MKIPKKRTRREKAVHAAKITRAMANEQHRILNHNGVMRSLLTNHDNVPAFMTEGYISLGNGNYRASGRKSV